MVLFEWDVKFIEYIYINNAFFSIIKIDLNNMTDSNNILYISNQSIHGFN
jgi:hypothetical protein